MEGTVLEDVLLLLAATIAVVVGLRRLRMPPIIGFLAVGMTVGPHAMGWVATTETTRALAEFGIVFLLFTLGLEFSLPRLIATRREVFGLGSLQVGADHGRGCRDRRWPSTCRLRSRWCWAARSPCPRQRSCSSS